MITSTGIVNQASAAGQEASRSLNKVLDQNDFLKLLTMQLQNQDPMNPQTNTDFVAQMAQFTSLEQSKEMSSNMALMRQQEEVQTATLLLGRAVLLSDGSAGTVDKVTLQKDGSPRLLVGGKEYSLSQVADYQALPQDSIPTVHSGPTTLPLRRF